MDCFEIIISTQQMHNAAWKYGQKQQVLMAHALLAILLALDEKGSGVPIAFIIFTAWDSAKVTHADYNTAVLKHLLGLFLVFESPAGPVF